MNFAFFCDKQIETDLKGTKACAWGLYIFLVRGHCRKRPMISFFFFFSFSFAFCCFFWWDGVVCDIALRFQWLWPPPPNLLTLKTHTQPPSLPQPPSSSRCSWARRLRFTLVAVRLRSLVGNCLHLSCGVLHLRLAFSVIILHSLTAIGTNTGNRENQKETKREEIPLKVNH